MILTLQLTRLPSIKTSPAFKPQVIWSASREQAVCRVRLDRIVSVSYGIQYITNCTYYFASFTEFMTLCWFLNSLIFMVQFIRFILFLNAEIFASITNLQYVECMHGCMNTVIIN